MTNFKKIREERITNGEQILKEIRKNNIGIAKRYCFAYIENKEIKEAFKQYCKDAGKMEEYLEMNVVKEFGMYRILAVATSEKLLREFARKNKVKFRTI